MEQSILTTQRKDGTVYTYRSNRLNIMSPDEWKKFYGVLKDIKKPLFNSLLQTGGRIMEVLHIQAGDFDFDNKTLLIKTVKQRTRHSDGCVRKIKLSTQYCNQMRILISDEHLKDTDYLFLDNSKLPEGYGEMLNKEKKKYYEHVKVGYSALFKRALKLAGLDSSKYSLHNIRKTSETWLCFLNINHLIVLKRFGHNQSTALNHYIVADPVDEKYKYEARLLLGDLFI